MSKLAAVKAGQQQMTIDEYLALDRDASPPEPPREGPKEPSTITAGTDPNPIRTELVTVGDVSRVKKGTEPHLDGNCPYVVQCESRRQRLSTYREHQPCHWLAFRNVGGCPIYRNGGNDDVT